MNVLRGDAVLTDDVRQTHGAGAWAGLAGVDTGFAGFSGPGSSNVPDSDGAFSPFFRRRDQHPSFTAYTDSYRSTLAELAYKSQNGDASAAQAYREFTNDLDTSKRLYDIAYSRGLNDRNSLDAMKLVKSRMTDQEDRWLMDDRVDYLAAEALQRGQNVRSLAPAQAAMSSAFDTGYAMALSTAANGSRSSVASQLLSLKGASKMAGFAMKRALQTWEGKNGLRSDAMRSAVMKQAGEYYAQAQLVSGLNRFSTDCYAIVDAAASKVGAVGSGTDNVFDRFNRAKGTIRNGFVTYHGAYDTDVTKGYGETRQSTGETAVKTMIEDCLIDHVGRTIGSGSDSFFSGDTGKLKADLVAGLAAVSPAAASSPSGTAMLNEAADKIIAMASSGRVDLSELSLMYTRRAPAAPFDPGVPEATAGAAEFRDVAGSLVSELVGNRSMFRYGLDFERNPEYTRNGISVQVDAAIDGKLRDTPELAAMAKDNPELMADIRATLSDYIFSTNMISDPHAAGSGNVAEAERALRDRVSALFVANDLRKLGVISGSWTPRNTPVEKSGAPASPSTSSGLFAIFDPKSWGGLDSQMRGNSREAVDSIWGDLARRLESYERETYGNVDTDSMDDAEYARYHAIHGLKTGIDKLTKSWYDPGWYTSSSDVTAGARANDLRASAEYDLGMTDGVVDFRKTRSFVDAVKARASKRAVSAGELLPGADQGKAMALNMLTADMFSDVSNPVLAGKADAYVKKRMMDVGPNLTPAHMEAFKSRLLPATMAALKTVLAENPAMFMELADDDRLYSRLDRLTAKLFKKVADQSEFLEQLRLQKAASMQNQREEIRNAHKE